MTRILFCFLLLFVAFRGLQAADSSGQFLNAYQSYQEGEKLERDGSTQDALKKYRFAESLLVEIEKNDPSWQKAVVEYRLKKTRDGLGRLQAGGASDAAAFSPVPDVATEGISPDENLGNAGPSISIVPPGSTSKSNAGNNSSEVKRLKKMMESLRLQLQEANSALTSNKIRAKDLESIKWVEERSKLEKELQVAKNQVTDLNEKLHERDSWESDLKSLQKRLDDAVADKVALEEDYKSRECQKDESNARLQQQLEEVRGKLAAGSAYEQQCKKLSSELDVAKKDMASMKEQLDRAGQAAKDYEAKNDALKKEFSDTSERLKIATKQANELAPLREKYQQLQQVAAKDDAASQASKQKVADLEKEASRLKDLSSKRESGLRADLQALEEERNSISMKLTQLSAAARDAAKVKGLETEAAALKRTIIELQEKQVLADQEIAKAREVAESSSKEAREYEKKLSSIASSVAADRAVLEEERQHLLAKIDDASKKNEELRGVAAATGPLASQINELKVRLAENSKASDEAKSNYDKALQSSNNHLAEMQGKLDAATALKQMIEKQNSSLQEQLKGAMGQMATLVDHGEDPEGLRSQIKKLQQQMDANAADYAQSQARIAELIKAAPEQNKLIQQKEQQMNLAKQDADKLRSELAKSNQTIADLQHRSDEGDDRLKKLQIQLTDLTKSIPLKEKQLADAQGESARLRSEISEVKSRLVTLEKKGTASSEQLKNLKESLAEKDAQLERYSKRKGKSGGSDKLSDENDLLRGIVLRQVKEEARRSQARRLLEDEMKRLNVQSQTLSDQISVLSSPATELTPQERSLFKTGQIVVADSGNGKIEASVSAPIAKDQPDSTFLPAKETNPAGQAPPDQVTNAAPADASVVKTNGGAQEIPWEGKLKECLAKAKDEFDRQDYLQAENTFQEALKISPDDYFALSNIGVVEFQLGKMTEAEMFLKRAASKSKESSFALTTLGIVHYRQQRLDEAQKVLRKAVEVNAQDFTAHNYLGIVLAASGNGKAGEGEIMKAIEINPQYADAHFNLAVIYATGKPPAKMMAKKHYAKAIELGAPPDPSLERLVQ